MKRYVLGFYFDGDKVLLINKTKPDWQREKLNGLGGSIEAGETPLMAMVREFREESTLDTVPQQWELVATLRGNAKTGQEWEMHVYRGSGSIDDGFLYKSDEGLVLPLIFSQLPHHMEQTARWLCGLCYDKSRGIRAEIEI